MIRLLESKDIDRVMEIWLETSKIAHSFIDESYWEENYEVVKNDYIPMGDTYLYEEDDIIKGFICIINAEFIGAIFMDNKYRGVGIGTKLINFLKNKHEKLRLTVYKENVSSVSFYKAKGFNIITEELDEATNSVEYLMEYNE